MKRPLIWLFGACATALAASETPPSEFLDALVWRGRVVYVETAEVARACKTIEGKSEPGLGGLGCYTVRIESGGPVCYVVSLPIRAEQDFLTPGHEFAGHCVRGLFHDRRGRWHVNPAGELVPGPHPAVKP